MKTITSLLFILICLSSCSFYGPVAVSSNEVGRKLGKACVKHLFGLIPMGSTDISIAKAAHNGGISKISSVDSSYSNYLFMSKRCTHVNGN